MNKRDMIITIAQNTDLSPKLVGAVMDAYTRIVLEQLSAGNKVAFIGFGAFTVKTVAARSAHHPKTGQKISCPAKKLPKFKPAKSMIEALNLRKQV